MNPNFPVYIVSKGRSESRYTAVQLDMMKVPYSIVIEEQEYDKYSEVIPREKILILDKKYQDNYYTFDNLNDSKSKGPGPARNFAWDHSMKLGAKWHWIMDDNIRRFYRLNKNRRFGVTDGTIFKCMEDFTLRWTNVGMSGPNYHSFVPLKYKRKPFIINTRIYSCNLINNDIPQRWRGRYNEDTDLSLSILKSGLCTIQFNAFLQGKIRTQALKGGNTDEFYKKEGTIEKSKMIKMMHPELTKIVFRYGRCHHSVNYSGFKQRLIPKIEINRNVSKEINNYGMELVNYGQA